MTTKDGMYGLAYGFWLNRIFAYFGVACGIGKESFMKQMFNLTMLENNECIPRRSGSKSKYIVADLIDEQTRLREELEEMTVALAKKDVEILALKATAVKGGDEGPGQSEGLGDKNDILCKKVKNFKAKVEYLTQQLLRNHAAENERITMPFIGYLIPF